MATASSVASRLAVATIRKCLEGVTPDVTGKTLSNIAYRYIIENNAEPALLGYCGFPASVAISVNNVCCHGVPNLIPLRKGDLIKIDTVVRVAGFHGDCTRSAIVGGARTNSRAARLIHATKKAKALAIAKLRPGMPIKEIGQIIEESALRSGYKVLPGYCGHHIGSEMHQLPYIPHTKNDDDTKLSIGSIFTIEPILIDGENVSVKIEKDGWSVALTDAKGIAAQEEDTILLGKTGARILTQ